MPFILFTWAALLCGVCMAPQQQHSHHVVVEACGAHGDDLESLQHAGSRHDGVGGGDGRNDVLHHPLGQLVRYTLEMWAVREVWGVQGWRYGVMMAEMISCATRELTLHSFNVD